MRNESGTRPDLIRAIFLLQSREMLCGKLSPKTGAVTLLLQLPFRRDPPHPNVAEQHIDDDDAQRRHDPLEVHHFVTVPSPSMCAQ